MPPENNYYNEVILNDPTLTVNNPVEGHEIQIIIGSPSKVAKGTLIDFAKKLTEHTRVNTSRQNNRGRDYYTAPITIFSRRIAASRSITLRRVYCRYLWVPSAANKGSRRFLRCHCK